MTDHDESFFSGDEDAAPAPLAEQDLRTVLKLDNDIALARHVVISLPGRSRPALCRLGVMAGRPRLLVVPVLYSIICTLFLLQHPALAQPKLYEVAVPDGPLPSALQLVVDGGKLLVVASNGAPVTSTTVAEASFTDSLDKNGWTEFRVKTHQKQIPNDLQAYGAGFLEGLSTAARISQFYSNLVMTIPQKGPFHNVKHMLSDTLKDVRAAARLAANPAEVQARPARLLTLGIKSQEFSRTAQTYCMWPATRHLYVS